MAIVISGLNYNDKTLDWFLKDNDFNDVIYNETFPYEHAIDPFIIGINYGSIFNEAYKICIRINAESHPERYIDVRYRIDYMLSGYSSITGGYKFIWLYVYLMLEHNYQLAPPLPTDVDRQARLIINVIKRRLEGIKKDFDFGGENLFDHMVEVQSNYLSNITVECKAYKFLYFNPVLGPGDYDKHSMAMITDNYTKARVYDLIESLGTKKERLELIDFIKKVYQPYLNSCFF